MPTRYSVLLLLIIVIAFSCDKDSGNSVGPGDSDPVVASEYGSIVVRVVDENENPFEGMSVSIRFHGDINHQYIKDDSTFSNSDGIARFDSLQPGNYSIAVDNYNYQSSDLLVPEAPNIWHDMDGIIVSEGETVLKSFYYPVGIVDIAVKAEFLEGEKEGFNNIELYFPECDRTVYLDEQGRGVLENITIQINTIGNVTVLRDGIVGKCSMGWYTDSNGWLYLHCCFDTEPVVEILSPQDGYIFSGKKVRLSCKGHDFEDGELTDSAFTWYSDLDYTIGTGREITPVLSLGQHEITLTGEDSDGNSIREEINIIVSLFSEQFYFPLPNDGLWKYRHETPEFVFTTDTGDIEHWALDDMTVTTYDITTRTCHMDWIVVSDGEDLAYSYTLTDLLDIDGNRIEVTSTDEVLSIYEGDDLVRELAVVTYYTPYYPLLADYLDPQAGSQEEVTLTAESALKYTVMDLGFLTKEHTETVTVSYETGSPEDITTDSDTYTTIPFHSTYNGVERTWWLARGIGIVQMEYDLFGETVTASLYETNMADFAGSVGKQVAKGNGGAPVRIQLDASTDETGRMREIMNVMRGMCPR